MAELKELFEFFSSERADVRKMATAGIAQISKDNSDLNTFVCKKENKDLVQKFCDLIDPRLPKDIVQTLADVLLALVNISVDTSCCETFVNHNVPLKLLKVYETLQVKGDEVQNSPVLCELSLMALNNLTAVSSAACEQVLELDDEDLAGYHFGRLKTHYDRSPDFFDAPAAEEENKEGENKKRGGKAVVEELNDDGTSKESSAAAASPASSTRKTPLPYEVAKRLEEEILPYLDDIQDVWINQEGDE